MANANLIGLLAGVASAIVFSSAAMPSVLAKLLFLLVPLPVLIAGLGWGLKASALAILTAMLMLAIALNPGNGMVFGVGFAAPAAFFAYLLLLGRREDPSPAHSADETDGAGPADPAPPTMAAEAGGSTPHSSSSGTTISWYPIGHVVGWASAFAGLFAVAVTFAQGQDLESYQASVRDTLQRAVIAQLDPSARQELGEEQVQAIADLFVAVMPAMVAIMWLSMMLLNLWLAGRITNKSNLLARPWPHIPAIRYPALMALALALAVLASLSESISGLAATGVAGALMLAFALLGLAVVHALTQGNRARTALLSLTYGGLFILFQLVAPVLVVLALIDQLFDLRGRKAGAPPIAPT